MIIKTLVRIAALLSAINLITGSSQWHDVEFIMSVVMIAIWAHAEWDKYKGGKL